MNRLFIGMDVHKEKIVLIGLPEEGSHPVVRDEFGGGDLPRLTKRIQTLSRSWKVDSCYEAGPSGYGLARIFLEAGIPCRVVAPSLIPRRPGNRVKQDGQPGREGTGACPSSGQQLPPPPRFGRGGPESAFLGQPRLPGEPSSFLWGTC